MARKAWPKTSAELLRIMKMRQFAQDHGFTVTPNGGLARVVTPNDYLMLWNALHDLLAFYDQRGNWTAADVKRLAEIREMVK